jgi:hypothetical protein
MKILDLVYVEMVFNDGPASLNVTKSFQGIIQKLLGILNIHIIM